MDINNWEKEFDKLKTDYRTKEGFLETDTSECFIDWEAIKSFIKSILADSQRLKAMDVEKLKSVVLQELGFYDGIKNVKNMPRHYIESAIENLCSTFGAPASLKPLNKDGIKSAINDWLSYGESWLTPDDVDEIAEAIYSTFGTPSKPGPTVAPNCVLTFTAPRTFVTQNKRLKEAVEYALHFASGHYDEDAQEDDPSPDDMTAHLNGLIVKKCRQALAQKERT